jgi:phosphoenolpyruvate synthase/pyruvate phosphate dikinase
VLDLSECGAGDVELVGGKCASLGELFRSLAPRGVRAWRLTVLASACAS